MDNLNFFNQILEFGNSSEEVIITSEVATSMGININFWEKMGVLKKYHSANKYCSGCGNRAPLIIKSIEGEIKSFIDCPQCGMFPLSNFENKEWSIDFLPLVNFIHKSLQGTGVIQEIIPNLLWRAGRVALVGQSRELYCCCAINSWKNNDIVSQLPEGKQAILVVFGNAPKNGNIGSFEADRVFCANELLLPNDNEILFDSSPIIRQLQQLQKEPKPRTSKKYSIIGDLAIKLKIELKQYMLGNYSAIMQAELSDREYKFPVLTQSALAQMFNVERVYIKRALDKDMELRSLFDAANNKRSTMAYGHKSH